MSETTNLNEICFTDSWLPEWQSEHDLILICQWDDANKTILHNVLIKHIIYQY